MNKNLSTLTLEMQQSQLDARKNLEFFQDGYVDGYNLAYWLGQSLWLDGFDNLYGYQFVELLMSFATDEEVKTNKVKKVRLTDLNNESYRIYPEGVTIMFHCTFFLNVHEFISAIGDQILHLPRNDSRLYSWWVKREYVYTYTYLDSFFRSFTKLLNSLPDFKSNVMNLHISRNIPDEDFSALSTITKKEKRFEEIINRIKKAIDHGFYLEAIALEESCISDRLSLALYIKGVKAGTKSLAKLIQNCSEFIPSHLVHQLDLWRVARNKSIHNLVRSSPLEELAGLDELDEITTMTASSGLHLLFKVSEWFEKFVLYEMNPYHFRIPVDVKNLTS